MNNIYTETGRDDIGQPIYRSSTSPQPFCFVSLKLINAYGTACRWYNVIVL